MEGERENMKILIIADEVWNDKIHGNNVLSNWFNEFPAEFCEIYCSPGIPYNKVCNDYFQLTDKMMAKSILSNTKAGQILRMRNNPYEIKNVEDENKKLYSFLKSITGDFLRLIRQMIWYFGKYDLDKLNNFLDDQKPDIIFAARYSSLKLLKIEKYASEYLNVPIVAFTGDDEFSLQQIKISPFYWVYILKFRSVMKRQIPKYSLYYTHSDVQAKKYHEIFGVKTKVLLKSGEFNKEKVHEKVNDIIKIVYIGKLYCNRWKTLSIIAKQLKEINKSGKRAILEIYTLDKITKKQNDLLNDQINSYIKGGVKPEDIPKVYNKSDIVLHVESFDLKNKLATKYSFSTKVVDSLASGCALWTIGWEEHCACKYLKKNNCAFVSTSKEEIKNDLGCMINNPNIIIDYANRAYEFGKNNLEKEIIQKKILMDFNEILES